MPRQNPLKVCYLEGLHRPESPGVEHGTAMGNHRHDPLGREMARLGRLRELVEFFYGSTDFSEEFPSRPPVMVLRRPAFVAPKGATHVRAKRTHKPGSAPPGFGSPPTSDSRRRFFAGRQRKFKATIAH
ncbi:MAG: hypothetical protein ABSC55_19240 [Syntrophorhabdales bacterium]|jgi:hypothetical protein